MWFKSTKHYCASCFRCKKLIKMLHGFGASVDYPRLLKLETQIANTILDQMVINNGIYVPRNIVKGEHIFFAIDNSDFAEDTPDGKNTLHGTTVSVYQLCIGQNIMQPLELTGVAHERSLNEIPSTFTTILPCQAQRTRSLSASSIHRLEPTCLCHFVMSCSMMQHGFWEKLL